MTAAEYRARAEKALLPGDGMRRPSVSQISEAAVWADLAKSAAIEQLAATGTPLRPAIHHST